MYLTKFVHLKSGKIIMSILLGFGLATLFREACKGKNCVLFRAPKLEDIEDKVFKQDGKCYKFTPENVTCDKNKKRVRFIGSSEEP